MILYVQIKDIETYELDPVSDEDYRKMLKLKTGDFLKIETWKGRNVNFHRKFFALINCAVNHLPEDSQFDRFRNVEYLRKYLMICTGNCEVIIGFSGKESYIPNSISFKSMDEEAFSKIYSSCLDAILKYFLKHLSQEDFEKDILNFL